LRAADPAPIQALRELVFDSFERWSPRPYRDAGVRIVDIDDETLARVGQWPWPRTEIARLIDRLNAMGASAIALDAIFAEPDRTSPKNILPVWQRQAATPLPQELAALPDHDELLAQSIGRAPAVLGIVLTDRGAAPPKPLWGMAVAGADPAASLITFDGALGNLPQLEAKARGLGALNSAPDLDGVIRNVPMLFNVAGAGLYPALSTEALRVAAGAASYVVKGSGASGFGAFGQDVGMNALVIGELQIPTDSEGRVALYDTGPVPGRTIPAWKVLDPATDASEISGKIVFVGTGAAGLNDLRTTPLRPLVPGAEIHAQIAEQIRLGAFLQRPNWMTGAELAWMAALCAALLWTLGRAGPALAAVFGAAAVAASFAASGFAFARLGLLTDPVYPALAALALYLAQSLMRYVRTERDRRYLKGAFGRYVSPVLLEQLVQDSSRLRLGGEMRQMSILFCDIRGFTGLAETMDAEALTHFINGFLTPMTDCVLARAGTIDKYMGDCIMAFWNAPIAEPRHAEYAVRAALDMTAALGGLNETWRAEAAADGRPFKDVAVGIGIATGACCVGNLGSEQRFDYSVLGDDVNLASRLETQTKTYGVPVIVSEATQAALPGFAALELDLVRVKGKAKPARIFAVLGDESMGGAEWYAPLAAAHGAMLADFRARRWPQAGERLASLAAAAPPALRKLYGVYAARIEALRAAPPPDDWDGVIVMESK
jgi:adenylate cyclase